MLNGAKFARKFWWKRDTHAVHLSNALKNIWVRRFLFRFSESAQEQVRIANLKLWQFDIFIGYISEVREFGRFLFSHFEKNIQYS